MLDRKVGKAAGAAFYLRTKNFRVRFSLNAHLFCQTVLAFHQTSSHDEFAFHEKCDASSA